MREERTEILEDNEKHLKEEEEKRKKGDYDSDDEDGFVDEDADDDDEEDECEASIFKKISDARKAGKLKAEE